MGYGFIAPDDGSGDLFARCSEIEGRGFKDLEEGQKAEYQVGQGQKGPSGPADPPAPRRRGGG